MWTPYNIIIKIIYHHIIKLLTKDISLINNIVAEGLLLSKAKN